MTIPNDGNSRRRGNGSSSSSSVGIGVGISTWRLTLTASGKATRRIRIGKRAASQLPMSYSHCAAENAEARNA
jgi:hypothetical protein